MAPEYLGVISEEEKHQKEECERIIQFRDEILSGHHPRIKVPAHLVASKKASESGHSTSPAVTALSVPSVPSSSAPMVNNAPTGPKSMSKVVAGPLNGTQAASKLCSFNANAPQEHLTGLESSFDSSSNMSGIPTGPRATVAKRFNDAAGNAQFDPILLTKSDDLIKAEIQLQRKRLEGALAEQLQQHRATKTSQAAEAPVEFDLADVLMKALTLVQSSAVSQTDANVAANASGAEVNSVDDDTFYSSKHDTPDSHQTHHIKDPDETGEVQAREDSHYEPPMFIEATPVLGQPSAAAVLPFALSSANATQPQNPREFEKLRPDPQGRTSTTRFDIIRTGVGVDHRAGNVAGVPMEVMSSQESGEASSSRDSGQVGVDRPTAHAGLQSVTHHLVEQSFGRRQCPISRAHNLSPIAPQPAHVLPLVTSRQPPVPQPDAPPAQATPAQVAALRNERSNGSSPETSPQGGKPNKKGKKRPKRKADRMAANTVASPYIKPESRSSSPLSAPRFNRPSKRQRHAHRPFQDHQGYGEPRAEEPAEPLQPSYVANVHSRQEREERAPAVYGSLTGQYIRQDSRPVVLTEPIRYERDLAERNLAERDLAESLHYTRRASVGAQPYPYAATETRTIRSVPRAAVDGPHSFYDIRDRSRTVARQVTDPVRSRSPFMGEDHPFLMGPPRLPLTRVVHVDEFGREYLQPPAPPPDAVMTRRPVVPRPAHDEREEFIEIPRSTRIIQRSVAPTSTYGEPEVIYERGRPPVRAASTMPDSMRYDKEVVYHSPASPSGYAMTRRVVTRPAEYAIPDYRYHGERDYAAGPPSFQAGGDDYYEIRTLQERRPADEVPQEYRVRGATVRPEPAVGQSEMVRMSSVHPELVPVEYGGARQLDDAVTANIPQPRVYGTRPMGPPSQQYVRRRPEYEARSHR